MRPYATENPGNSRRGPKATSFSLSNRRVEPAKSKKTFRRQRTNSRIKPQRAPCQTATLNIPYRTAKHERQTKLAVEESTASRTHGIRVGASASRTRSDGFDREKSPFPPPNL